MSGSISASSERRRSSPTDKSTETVISRASRLSRFIGLEEFWVEREERIGAVAALRAEVRRLGEALLAEPVEHVRVVVGIEERQTASVLQRGAEIDRQDTGLIRGLVHHTDGKGPAYAVVLLSEADLRAPKLIDSSFHNNYIRDCREMPKKFSTFLTN